jgi:hypothetical protein
MSYVSAALRREVITRAGNCCEYCRLSQEENPFTFHIEHVIAEKHSGETESANLCLSCPDCNSFKGSDISSIDRLSGQLTPLFNPRTHDWQAHFRIDFEEATIEPLTPEGRVTVILLRMNSPQQVEFRAGLIKLGLYPCAVPE